MGEGFSAITAEHLNAGGRDYLPGLLGIDITAVGDGFLEAVLPVRRALMAPNGFLHAGTVVTFAAPPAPARCPTAPPASPPSS